VYIQNVSDIYISAAFLINECIAENHYSPEAKHSLGRIVETLNGANNDVDAFGYNSAESERVWMKSGAL